jgi:NAD(P)-dependent dehydrogenase (short-subunit alcohol dehydrogenase family)
MGRLTDKTAIVTGAAQGIGLAIARRFAREGARLLVADRNEAAITAVAAELEQEAMVVDVAVKTEVGSMIDRAERLFGHIDILVNNAGVFSSSDLLELTEAEFDRIMAVNLKSILFAIQAAAPRMIERKAGAIVNVTSLAGLLGAPNALAYCVSKAGANQLTNVAALALAPHGIRVNAVGPGTFATDMATAFYANPELQRRVLERTPMGRMGQAEEAASAVLFLASEDASYVTGKTIYVDGGRLGLNLTVTHDA